MLHQDLECCKFHPSPIMMVFESLKKQKICYNRLICLRSADDCKSKLKFARDRLFLT